MHQVNKWRKKRNEKKKESCCSILLTVYITHRATSKCRFHRTFINHHWRGLLLLLHSPPLKNLLRNWFIYPKKENCRILSSHIMYHSDVRVTSFSWIGNLTIDASSDFLTKSTILNSIYSYFQMMIIIIFTEDAYRKEWKGKKENREDSIEFTLENVSN